MENENLNEAVNPALNKTDVTVAQLLFLENNH